MTKKDFEAIANAFKAQAIDNAERGNVDGDTALALMQGRLAAYFQTQNPRFDIARFYKACDKPKG